MHILDIILGIFLLFFVLKGLHNGFIKSVINLIGLIVIVFVISKLGYLVKDGLMNRFGLGEVAATIISYLLIAILIFFIAQIVIKFVHMIFNVLRLEWLDKLLGMVFGLLNGGLIIAIILLLINLSPFAMEVTEFTKDSVIVDYVQNATETMSIKYKNVITENNDIKKKIQNIEKTIKEATEKVEQEFRDKIKK